MRSFLVALTLFCWAVVGLGQQSVNGVPNQIIGGSTTPYQLLTPQFEKSVYQVDGFTTALYPGIGVAPSAWSSGTYSLGTSVSYAAASTAWSITSNIITVTVPNTFTGGDTVTFTSPTFHGGAATNLVVISTGLTTAHFEAAYTGTGSATEAGTAAGYYMAVGVTTGVAPGTNAAIWTALPNGNTPTQTDVAFYYTLAAAEAGGTSYTLNFGNTNYSPVYITNICLLEPSSQSQVNLIGQGRGFNNQLTTLKAGTNCNSGWVITSPDKTGSLPYNLVISGMLIDGGGSAYGCIKLFAEKVGQIEHIGCTDWSYTQGGAIPIQIGDGTAPYTNGGYQYNLNDIFVSGAVNASSNRANVSATVVSGAPSFTISSGGSYYNAPTKVYLWGFGNGTTPCTTMGTISTTYSGSVGSYVLTGITPTGFSGCSGTLYTYVPDIPAAAYGMIISLMTDSTFKDLVVAGAGWKYGIFYNGSSNDLMEHEHVYSDSQIQIQDSNNNAHHFAEVDSPPNIGIVSGSNSTWVSTSFTNGGLSGEEEYPGVVGFSVPSGGATIVGTMCGNAATHVGQVFNLVVGPSGPYAHGGSFGSTNIIGGTECDTLTQENSLAANVNLPLGVMYGTTHGSNGTAGVATLASGTATVSTTAIAALAAAGAAGQTVQLTLESCSSCGALSVGTVTPGTSFVINSTNASDASTVYWEIKKLN